MDYIECIKLVAIPVSLASALLAYLAAKRAATTSSENSVNHINTTFSSSGALGPIVLQVFPERARCDQIEIQKKVVQFLHQLNYLSSSWTARNQKILGFIPCPLLSRREWSQKLTWYKNQVWLGWITKDSELNAVNDHLIENEDFQNPAFGEYYTKLIAVWKKER